MKARVQRIFQGIEPAPDALLFANAIDPHLDAAFFYVFDVPGGLFERSVAVAHPDGKVDVLSSPLEEESARQAAKRDPDVAIHVFQSGAEWESTLRSLLPEHGRLGLNYRELTHEGYRALEKLRPQASLVDASDAVRVARMVKDSVEVERLERAGAICSKVALEIPGMLRSGITETGLAAEIEYRMMHHGASGRSFSTIVGFGAHGAEPHYQPEGERLESGMSMVCDFGAYYRRYASDITRSFHFGRTDSELKRVHETVEQAQQAALEVLRPGVAAKEVHMAAQAVIDRSPWKGRFTHGLGHSIGLSVHDGFGLSPTVDEPLREGMAITIEPGIYLPGRGGVRIEDDVLVTKSGYRFLTTAPRGYLEVAA